MAYDDGATRDFEPPVVDSSKQQAAIVKGETFAEYMAKRNEMAGNVVASEVEHNSLPSKEAAPLPVPPTPPAAAMPPTVHVQGGSLRTWSFRNPNLEAAQVVLSSEGRPIEATIELWQGPGNIPWKMKAYVEDGLRLPFSTVIATPSSGHDIKPSFGDNVNTKPGGGVPNTVAIRNEGALEFPFAAVVVVQDVDQPSSECLSSPSMTIQGGALRSFPFDPSVSSVQILLETDGRPLFAKVEILQGPNNDKQVIELYSENGLTRPFFAIVETPDAGSVIRVQNTASMEYPLSAKVVPDSIDDFSDGLDMDGDVGGLNSIGFGDAPRGGRYR